MIPRIYSLLASLDLAIWLLGGVMALLATGSFVCDAGSGINDMALLAWLAEVPIRMSWWLWGTLGLLALLSLNTVLCSLESLRAKWLRGSLLVRMAPQLMHVGFLFIVLAHLFTAYGGLKDGGSLPEGGTFSFPDGSRVELTRLEVRMGPMGMPLDFSGTLRHLTSSGELNAVFSPNHPYFYKGFGVYLKQVEPFPVKRAIVEVHREPGAGLALVGAVFFTIANILLIWLRRGQRVTAENR
ncbi:MAG: hypothetical protein WCP20_00255 [Desulfuromonadales bacterium]